MNNKFASLISALTDGGMTENQALQAANQVDSAYINFASEEDIKKIASDLIEEEENLAEALSQQN